MRAGDELRDNESKALHTVKGAKLLPSYLEQFGVEPITLVFTLCDDDECWCCEDHPHAIAKRILLTQFSGKETKA